MSRIEMPLRGREATQLSFMWSLYKVLRDDQSLKSRMASIGLWWRYKGLLKQLENMCRACFNTVPDEAYRRFDAALQMQDIQVVVRGGAVDSTGDYMAVPRSAMLDVLSVASKECLLCDGGHQDKKKCLYRKAIKKLCLPDLSHAEDNGICMGKQFDWKGGQ